MASERLAHNWALLAIRAARATPREHEPGWRCHKCGSSCLLKMLKWELGRMKWRKDPCWLRRTDKWHWGGCTKQEVGGSVLRCSNLHARILSCTGVLMLSRKHFEERHMGKWDLVFKSIWVIVQQIPFIVVKSKEAFEKMAAAYKVSHLCRLNFSHLFPKRQEVINSLWTKQKTKKNSRHSLSQRNISMRIPDDELLQIQWPEV